MDNFIKLYPEILPPEIGLGYQMKDIYYSKKLSIPIRRIVRAFFIWIWLLINHETMQGLSKRMVSG
jgi:hypothetical protein